MDFNFGEIAEPVSRAFYDDYDDASLNLPFTKPVWKYNSEEVECKVKNNQFILVEGINVMNLVFPSILKNAVKVAKLENHKVEVFRIEDYTICVVDEKDLNFYSTITDLLEPWIQSAKQFTILSLQNACEYKSDEVLETSIIRSLQSDLDDIPALAVPNFVTGVSAGLSTLLRFKDVPFSAFVAYIDLYDEIAVKMILNFLKRLAPKLPVDDSAALKPINHRSNLYM